MLHHAIWMWLSKLFYLKAKSALFFACSLRLCLMDPQPPSSPSYPQWVVSPSGRHSLALFNLAFVCNCWLSGGSSSSLSLSLSLSVSLSFPPFCICFCNSLCHFLICRSVAHWIYFSFALSIAFPNNSLHAIAASITVIVLVAVSNPYTQVRFPPNGLYNARKFQRRWRTIIFLIITVIAEQWRHRVLSARSIWLTSPGWSVSWLS